LVPNTYAAKSQNIPSMGIGNQSQNASMQTNVNHDNTPTSTLSEAERTERATERAVNLSAQVRRLANETAANIEQAKFASQLAGFSTIITTSIVALALIIVFPLFVNMYFVYRQGRNMNKGTSSVPFPPNQLYRVLVAIGVIFTVILIIVYLNSLIWFNLNAPSQIITNLLETQKNFITIIGTAFASLVAFYFGTRGTQGSNVERTTTVNRSDSVRKALECIDVNPINGSIGVEIDSQVKATFSTSVRSSTINDDTFSVKDKNGNIVNGRITLTEDDMTIVFKPIPVFNLNSVYTVTIKKSIMDKSGASMVTDIEWHFTTVA